MSHALLMTTATKSNGMLDQRCLGPQSESVGDKYYNYKQLP